VAAVEPEGGGEQHGAGMQPALAALQHSQRKPGMLPATPLAAAHSLHVPRSAYEAAAKRRIKLRLRTPALKTCGEEET